MRLDDLAADRQAEAGVLAESLARRTIRIKALEDAVDVVGADAGAVVVDGDDDMAAAARHADDDAAIFLGHEGSGVLDQIGDDLAESQVMADHEIALHA